MIPRRSGWLRRAWRAIGWALVTAVVWGSLASLPELPVQIEGGDTAAHVVAYTVLMVWFAQLDEHAAARVALAAGFVAMGVGLEFAQGALSYRNFDVIDMAANATGVVLGWALAPPRGPRLLGWAESRLDRTRPGSKAA
jgi:VanZ family protein